jgi:hypothetical protein
MLIPLEWGLLDGDEKLTEPLRLVLLQAALAAALCALWLALPSQLVRAVGVPLLLTVLAFQLLAFARAVPKSLAFANANSQSLASKSVTLDEANLPNVYHFCFDGYSSLHFRENADSQHLDNEFTGFVFFPRTFANYPWTDLSVSSFLTGQFFTEGSLEDFLHAPRSEGLRRQLQGAGYKISIYSPDRARPWMYDHASDVKTAMQLAEENFGAADVARLAQIALVRAAPNSLKRQTLSVSDNVLGRIAALGANSTPSKIRKYGFYKRLSVPLVEQFLADEPGKSSSARYTYVHTILPHGPYVWNADCNADPIKSSYRSQSLCATLLMKKIVQQLKQLGRYENSVIIFQSDHGMHDEETVSTSEIQPFPPEVKQRIGPGKKSNRSPNGYFLRLHALLAIKPPQAQNQPMRHSSGVAQLADIPATVYDLVGLRVTEPDRGTALFALPETAQREVHVFYGDRRPFKHFSYTSAEGWQVH